MTCASQGSGAEDRRLGLGEGGGYLGTFSCTCGCWRQHPGSLCAEPKHCPGRWPVCTAQDGAQWVLKKGTDGLRIEQRFGASHPVLRCLPGRGTTAPDGPSTAQVWEAAPGVRGAGLSPVPEAPGPAHSPSSPFTPLPICLQLLGNDGGAWSWQPHGPPHGQWAEPIFRLPVPSGGPRLQPQHTTAHPSHTDSGTCSWAIPTVPLGGTPSPHTAQYHLPTVRVQLCSD